MRSKDCARCEWCPHQAPPGVDSGSNQALEPVAKQKMGVIVPFLAPAGHYWSLAIFMCTELTRGWCRTSHSFDCGHS